MADIPSNTIRGRKEGKFLRFARNFDIKIAAFITAAFFYAVLSQPTPDNIGIPELVIGLCLLAIVGVSGAFNVFSGRQILLKSHPIELRILSFLFVAVLIIGSISALHFNNNANEAIRDFIPYLYFLQPILLVGAFSKGNIKQNVNIICLCISAVGVSFSVRHFLSSGAGIDQIGNSFINSSGFYFSTDPSVLFGALYLFFIGISFGKKGGRTTLTSVVCLTLSAICLAALLLKGHRGPLGLFVIFSFLIAIFAEGRILSKALVILTAGIALVATSWDRIISAVTKLIQKNEAHGLNGRDLELSAVISRVAEHDYSEIFGRGWGSLFHNPVILYKEVNFTHLSFSYMYMKAGIGGIIITAIYLGCTLIWTYKNYRRYPGVAFASIAPLLIGFLINGSFRYLTFGWIALALALLAVDRQKNSISKPML